MKLRVTDRLLSALTGLILLALAAALISDAFLGGACFAWLSARLKGATMSDWPWIIGVIVALVLIAACDAGILLRRASGKHGFVVQKTENGELSISIRAIEGLVQKCVDKHEELHVTSTSLVNTRGGLVIKLRVGMAGGMNIPLVVNALQKQIKQYITGCSGVDVKEVKVQVENSAAKLEESPYAVPDMLQNTLPKEEQPVPEIQPEPEPEVTKEEKCLHQRLFGEEEQPAIVPAPPVTEAEPAGEPPAEEAEPAPELVMEVPEETSETEAEEMMARAEENDKTEEDEHEIAE